MSIAEPITPAISPLGSNGAISRSPADPYADGDGDRLFEVIRGQRVEKTMGLLQNVIAATLYSYFSQFCRENQLGHAVIETMFAIPASGNDRKPDVAFVSYQQWAKDRPIPEVNAWPIAPDLAVEVISPTDKAFDVMAKVREYFAGGVREVWQVYSNLEQVWVFSSPTTIRILSRADELTGEPLVPGFRMRVGDIFPLAEPNA